MLSKITFNINNKDPEGVIHRQTDRKTDIILYRTYHADKITLEKTNFLIDFIMAQSDQNSLFELKIVMSPFAV